MHVSPNYLHRRQRVSVGAAAIGLISRLQGLQEKVGRQRATERQVTAGGQVLHRRADADTLHRRRRRRRHRGLEQLGRKLHRRRRGVIGDRGLAVSVHRNVVHRRRAVE